MGCCFPKLDPSKSELKGTPLSLHPINDIKDRNTVKNGSCKYIFYYYFKILFLT